MSNTPLLVQIPHGPAGRKMTAAKQRRPARCPACIAGERCGVSPSRSMWMVCKRSPSFFYVIAGTRSAKQPKNARIFLRFSQSIPHLAAFVHPQLADRFRQRRKRDGKRRRSADFSPKPLLSAGKFCAIINCYIKLETYSYRQARKRLSYTCTGRRNAF